MSQRRVVVTGIGLVTPVGIGADPVFAALIDGRCGVGAIEAFDPSGFDSRIGGEIEPFKVRDYVPKSYRKSTKVMSRDIEIAVTAAYEAVTDAGLRTKCLIERGDAEDPPNVDPTRFGANIGAGLICADLTELAGALSTATGDDGRLSLLKWGAEGMTNLTPLWLLKFLPNMLACHVTIVHDTQGASNTITCGEASSHLAIGEAYGTIQRGAADLCICGGAESKINPMGILRQSLLKRLCTDGNDSPTTACRPFDTERSGAVVGEGGGLLILEEYEHARARGAPMYAEIVGFGASCNIHSWSEPHPEGEGITLAIERALNAADSKPDAVDLVGAFGPGTVEHDLSEAKGIRKALGSRGAEAPVLATCGAMGNNGAGTGAINLAIAILSMRNGSIPPSQNTDEIDPDCGLNVVRGKPVDARVNLGVSVGYALGGGQNAAIVFKRGPE
jgi:3-oxoacyl-[acyl-carrier-protein] synthase II